MDPNSIDRDIVRLIEAIARLETKVDLALQQHGRDLDALRLRVADLEKKVAEHAGTVRTAAMVGSLSISVGVAVASKIIGGFFNSQ